MHEDIITEFRKCVIEKRYFVTHHALEEIENDNLTVYDVESAILSGTIVERQKDKDTQEFKYRILGKALAYQEIEVVAKLNKISRTVIITVYEL